MVRGVASVTPSDTGTSPEESWKAAHVSKTPESAAPSLDGRMLEECGRRDSVDVSVSCSTSRSRLIRWWL